MDVIAVDSLAVVKIRGIGGGQQGAASSRVAATSVVTSRWRFTNHLRYGDGLNPA
jgi:hypothetical protein